eukprot:CAMPEP_0197518840 /NCGR_PEP_ID=MMETSP1318-20131121/4066_1 /TAXON_ID=552666 /ORGANISM="Partenskyella glossopodia, Strain RCC365" /LENGTH=322 /DNA_ID=CAMNT_0043069485 /DNA_START=178 /DNA_END=1146 /DNA_ORIENTATION=-
MTTTIQSTGCDGFGGCPGDGAGLRGRGPTTGLWRRTTRRSKSKSKSKQTLSFWDEAGDDDHHRVVQGQGDELGNEDHHHHHHHPADDDAALDWRNCGDCGDDDGGNHVEWRGRVNEVERRRPALKAPLPRTQTARHAALATAAVATAAVAATAETAIAAATAMTIRGMREPRRLNMLRGGGYDDMPDDLGVFTTHDLGTYGWKEDWQLEDECCYMEVFVEVSDNTTLQDIQVKYEPFSVTAHINGTLVLNGTLSNRIRPELCCHEIDVLKGRRVRNSRFENKRCLFIQLVKFKWQVWKKLFVDEPESKVYDALHPQPNNEHF